MKPLTSKQRAYLKSLANRIKPTVYVGREGISSPLIQAVEEAYHTNELVKLKVQRECPCSKQEAGEAVASATDSSVVQIVGNTVQLYRPDREKPTIVLPA